MLASVALIGGVIFRGRASTEPNELQKLGFDLCDDRLCLMRVKPGVTSLEDARRTVAKHGAIEIANNVSIYSIGDTRIGFSGLSKVETIYFDRLSGYPMPATIGDVLSYRGVPCALDVAGDQRGWNRISLIYPYGYITAASDFPLDMNLATPISALMIYSPNMSQCESLLPWLGFKSLRRYQEILSK